jgi:hypothetical protein
MSSKAINQIGIMVLATGQQPCKRLGYITPPIVERIRQTGTTR